MNKLNILVANSKLNSIGGSETFSYTLISELKKQGHFVEYFTFEKGLVSDKIENILGVFFKTKNKYDLILANHNTCVEKLYGIGYIIQTCHGIFPKLEKPSIFSNAYVSISQEIQESLSMHGISSKIILNGIDLSRFRCVNKLNNNLKSVLSLCHSIEANKLLKEVCLDLNIELKIAYKYDKPVFEIENKINEVDLVIGLGRSAYEAMACGRPVVVWDNRKYFSSVGDGYVKNILGFSVINNCSGRYLNKEYTKDDLKQEILKYNHLDSIFFREFAEKKLNITSVVHEYFDYYNSLNSSEFLKKKNNLALFCKIGKFNLLVLFKLMNRSYKLKKLKNFLIKVKI